MQNEYLVISCFFNFSRSGYVNLQRSPQIFLTNLFMYCKCMVHRMADEVPVDFILPLISSGVETVLTIKAKDKGNPNGLTDLVRNYEDLNVEAQSLVAQKYKSGLGDEEESTKEDDAPDDYWFMTLVPTLRELLSEEEVFLRSNKTSGAYNNAHHYLDVQFRLLRQDFVQPMKLGIQDFLKHRYELKVVFSHQIGLFVRCAINECII